MSAVETRQRFEAAVNAFVERVRDDPHILAVVLFGSLSYDAVWERSDVDLMLVTDDLKGAQKEALRRFVCLIEGDVNFHASLQTRSEFRREMEGALRGSFLHSALSRSRLVFCRDETLHDLYEDLDRLGERDRRAQLLAAGCEATHPLTKAEKFLRVKADPLGAYLWLTRAYTPLAKIEVALHRGIAGREVVDQALALNPELFGAIYSELLTAGVTPERVAAAVAAADGYLTGHLHDIFGPLLDFLADGVAERSATDVDDWARREMGLECASNACEWLADKGVVFKIAAPLRLTPHSPVAVDELAFYYDPSVAVPEGS